MKELVNKYAAKIVSAGLAEPGAPLIGGLDAELVWNRNDPATPVLMQVFGGLNINSLLFCMPTEPYRSILDYLCKTNEHTIYPSDCESRTFMHDLPIIRSFSSNAIIDKLKQRKSVIVAGKGVVTWGTVSPEQAFIFFSSLCFSCFVKFYSDYLSDCRLGTASDEQHRIFAETEKHLDPLSPTPPILMAGPFHNEAEVYRAVSEAGRVTVDHRLVDSFFGNVSFAHDGTLYISQTGSSLDELEGCIDPCPIDGSSCAALTASSEFVAHREVVQTCGVDGILHGHPKFAVIMSMDCSRADCPNIGSCHIHCSEERFIGDIPIVPGEVGTGPTGLCNTLPPAMKGRRGVIVYGHGLFTTATQDFNGAFAELLDIETMCRNRYFELIEQAR